jgi:hypothetical protein
LLMDDEGPDPLEMSLKPSLPPKPDEMDLGAKLEAAEAEKRQQIDDAPRRSMEPMHGSVRLDGRGDRKGGNLGLWVAGGAFVLAASAAAAYFMGLFG